MGPRKKIWAVRVGNGNVRNQHGMLILNTGKSKTTSATLRMKGHATSRCGIRLRQRRYESGHAPYRVRTSTSATARTCRSTHTPASRSAVAWHTFGVEVRERRISWFVPQATRAVDKRAC